LRSKEKDFDAVALRTLKSLTKRWRCASRGERGKKSLLLLLRELGRKGGRLAFRAVCPEKKGICCWATLAEKRRTVG